MFNIVSRCHWRRGGFIWIMLFIPNSNLDWSGCRYRWCSNPDLLFYCRRFSNPVLSGSVRSRPDVYVLDLVSLFTGYIVPRVDIFSPSLLSLPSGVWSKDTVSVPLILWNFVITPPFRERPRRWNSCLEIPLLFKWVSVTLRDRWFNI